MVRGVLFDLDGTLFDRDSAVRDLLGDQYRRFRLTWADSRRKIMWRELLELDAHGHGDKNEAYQRAIPESAWKRS